MEMILKMNDQVLDAAVAIPFRDTLLIPIKSDITKLFGTKQIKFQISIKDNKIIIESQEISKDLEIHDKHLEQKAIVIG